MSSFLQPGSVAAMKACRRMRSGENASQAAEIVNGIYGANTVTANHVQFRFPVHAFSMLKKHLAQTGSSSKMSPLVYADKPQTLDPLEDNIRRVIADIRPQMLEKVIENWTSRLDYIRASRGSPMPEIIFKM
ncbi:hypothetical protein TNCV_4358751 [Trichonephila clavipes]|nr:hypothetical protein TNCV_4358751 [Trichonephila clavipes]